MRNFTITAHSGCLGSRIDSLESVKKAVELGVEYAEIDINCLEDGVAVLKHDKVLESDKDLITIEEVFRYIKNTSINLNLDIKNKKTLKFIKEKAEEFKVVNRLLLSGVDEHDTYFLREVEYPINYLMNVEIEKTLEDKEEIKKYIDYAIKSNAIGLNIDYKYCTKNLVSMAHEKGLYVSVWTVDNKEDILKVKEMNVDNITSNRPDIM